MLAAQPDPDGARGVAIARTFLQMGNPAGAREALVTAQAATRTPTAAQRIAYAGILLQTGDERGAQILIRALDATTGLTAQQAADLNRLRAGAAIRDADALNTAGRQADAYDVLGAGLSRDPATRALTWRWAGCMPAMINRARHWRSIRRCWSATLQPGCSPRRT